MRRSFSSFKKWKFCGTQIMENRKRDKKNKKALPLSASSTLARLVQHWLVAERFTGQIITIST